MPVAALLLSVIIFLSYQYFRDYQTKEQEEQYEKQTCAKEGEETFELVADANPRNCCAGLKPFRDSETRPDGSSWISGTEICVKN